ncbi:MAG: hypothetical protein KBC60_07840 [Haliscomenobacter sp.]|nr:hypothetical protein [Haliscomenobacter sp.]
MSESELKLKMIQLIVSQKGEVLQELYQLILSRVYKEKERKDLLSSLEVGYQKMSEDQEREEDAFEWIEGTLNSEEL